MLGWLIYNLPWWAWAIVALAIWLVLAFLVGTLFGWKYARIMLWPAVASLALLGLYMRARQEGWADRGADQEAAIDRAENAVVEKRDEVHKLPDADLDKRVDRWEER